MLRLPVWCVVGDVLNPAKAASRVVTHLERHGKTVYCVNPSTKTVETEPLSPEMGQPSTHAIVAALATVQLKKLVR